MSAATKATPKGNPMQASILAQTIARCLAGITSDRVTMAWQSAITQLFAGSDLDTSRLVSVLTDEPVDIDTILRLRQASAEALQSVLRPTWRSRRLGVTSHLAGLMDGLHTVTAAALAVAMQSGPAVPPPEAPIAIHPASKHVEDISQQATSLTHAAHRTAEAAERVRDRCGAVVESSGMAFVNINTNAEASTELVTSIEQVSRDLTHTATASREASDSAEQAAGAIAELEHATGEIGTVTDIIRRIAAQTNMLALNATIEAARAGAAGRGFGVVANEVKDLAQQTARATANIDSMIKAIGIAVNGAAGRVRAIQDMTSAVERMAASGAAAVEQQRAAVIEISRTAQDTSAAVSQMHEGIEEVAMLSFGLHTTIEDLLSGMGILKVTVDQLGNTV
ncbi:MAG TPA: methyl-accepting chemotaxis protein [Rhodopila sp.]|nr:methyl-accepting chemotaxis protein [Rhodopila sp.]